MHGAPQGNMTVMEKRVQMAGRLKVHQREAIGWPGVPTEPRRLTKDRSVRRAP